MTLNTLEIILGVIILILAVGVLVTVSLQHSKKSGLGSIMGGSSDSFYGKNKARSKENVLKTLTIIFSIALAVLALILYAYHGSAKTSSGNNNSSASDSSAVVSTVESETEASEEPSAEESVEESAEESVEE